MHFRPIDRLYKFNFKIDTTNAFSNENLGFDKTQVFADLQKNFKEMVEAIRSGHNIFPNR